MGNSFIFLEFYKNHESLAFAGKGSRANIFEIGRFFEKFAPDFSYFKKKALAILTIAFSKKYAQPLSGRKWLILTLAPDYFASLTPLPHIVHTMSIRACA